MCTDISYAHLSYSKTPRFQCTDRVDWHITANSHILALKPIRLSSIAGQILTLPSSLYLRGHYLYYAHICFDCFITFNVLEANKITKGETIYVDTFFLSLLFNKPLLEHFSTTLGKFSSSSLYSVWKHDDKAAEQIIFFQWLFCNTILWIYL